MTKELFEKYNSSLKCKLVFHLGYDAGFFSEYNNMLYAIMYCLTHKIQFNIYCDDANFGYENGWQDYFEPFFEEVHDDFHHQNNYRYFDEPITSDICTYFKRLVRSIIKHDNSLYRPFYRFKESDNITKHKRQTGYDLYTQDIWNDLIKYPTNRLIKNPFDGKVICEFDFLSKINSLIWHLNEKTQQAIKLELESLDIHSNYVGIHIRRGDKINEAVLSPITNYMELVQSVTEIKEVFVATDDYRTVVNLRSEFPNYNFYSLVPNHNDGYNQSTFDKSDSNSKYSHMISLFADIEMLANAVTFVGTFSSNIGQYMAIRRNRNSCFFIDYKQ